MTGPILSSLKSVATWRKNSCATVKFFGKEKIADDEKAAPGPVQDLRAELYGGRAFASRFDRQIWRLRGRQLLCLFNTRGAVNSFPEKGWNWRMNESRLITETRANRKPTREDFTTDLINLASECSKKLLTGFDSFWARKFFLFQGGSTKPREVRLA
jgi:hypothetical protein